LPRVTFNPEKCRVGLEEGFTQATDLAEALVKKGMPFRKAYMAAGALVKRVQEKGITLRAATVELAQSVDPAFDALGFARVRGAFALGRELSRHNRCAQRGERVAQAAGSEGDNEADDRPDHVVLGRARGVGGE